MPLQDRFNGTKRGTKTISVPTEKGKTMREKLIELLKESGVAFPISTANFLIANGVTIATDNNVGDKWIPVTERLPDEKDSFLVATDDGVVGEAFLWEGYFYWQEGACDLYAKPIGKDVTHWMPLPEPPKGE